VTAESKLNLNLPIYEQAADWLIELREGEIDAAARKRLDTWFRASPEHIRAYLELSAIWEDGADADLDRSHSTNDLIARARGQSNVVPLDVIAELPEDTNQSGRQAIESRSEPRLSEATLSSETPQQTRQLQNEIPRHPREQTRRTFWRGRPRPLWAAAAIIACVVGSASFYLYVQRNLAFETVTGEQRFVKLVDGSTIELNSRSRVRVRFTDAKRDVDLIEGQALFHVAKDSSRPFIVHSGSTLVRAVGTQFDVYRKASGTTVTVVEGRVAVLSPMLQGERERNPSGSAIPPRALLPGRSPAASTATLVQKPEQSGPADAVLSSAPNAIYLSAGEQITVSPQALTHLTHTDPTVATAWTQHELVFDSTPLDEVAQDFNRYNTRQLIISDAALRDFHITGIFSSADPSSLLKFLRTQHDIVVEETDDDIRVSKK
jgi:transmembrane sensor